MSDKPIIACCWAGAELFSRDAIRSMPWDVFRPLLDTIDATWVCVFTGPRSEVDHPRLLRPKLTSFVDTAGWLEKADICISVDTAPAHLAGSLGIPTLLALPYSADWRWLEGRSDTPWYESMRLYRQPARGEWAPVVDAIMRDAMAFAFHGSFPAGPRRVPRRVGFLPYTVEK